MTAVVVLVASVARPTAQATPPTASALLGAAKAAAQADHKNILVDFGASWCGWCRQFDAFLQSAEVGPLVAQHLVVLKFTVQESPDKRALNTLGAQDLMNEWGGERCGLPFYVFLDAKGEKIADSSAMPSGANIGYPSMLPEIDSFMKLLERTAPGLSADDRGRIAKYLKEHTGRSSSEDVAPPPGT